MMPGVGKGREVKNEKECKRREKEDRVQDIVCMSSVTVTGVQDAGNTEWSETRKIP